MSRQAGYEASRLAWGRQAGLRQAGWRQAGLRLQEDWLHWYCTQEAVGALALLVLHWGAVGTLASLVLHRGMWGPWLHWYYTGRLWEPWLHWHYIGGCGSPGFAGTALGRLWEPWLCWYCTVGLGALALLVLDWGAPGALSPSYWVSVIKLPMNLRYSA